MEAEVFIIGIRKREIKSWFLFYLSKESTGQMKKPILVQNDLMGKLIPRTFDLDKKSQLCYIEYFPATMVLGTKCEEENKWENT